MSSPSVKGAESVADVAGDVEGAVVVEDSEDAEAVVARDWGGEDVEEDASDAVIDGDGESAEAENLEISCSNIDFGS